MINEFQVKEALKYAKGIAWDTCHKIYVLMDNEQMAAMKSYGYDPLISSDELTPDEMYDKLETWWKESCGLKFIEAVSTASDGTDFFNTLIEQGEDE